MKKIKKGIYKCKFSDNCDPALIAEVSLYEACIFSTYICYAGCLTTITKEMDRLGYYIGQKVYIDIEDII